MNIKQSLDAAYFTLKRNNFYIIFEVNHKKKQKCTFFTLFGSGLVRKLSYYFTLIMI